MQLRQYTPSLQGAGGSVIPSVHCLTARRTPRAGCLVPHVEPEARNMQLPMDRVASAGVTGVGVGG